MATRHSQRLIDPAERLPLELLVEVFHLCDTSLNHIGLKLPDGLFTARAPWVLTHVCQRWRSVALSSPQLWRKITINLSTDEDEEDGYTAGLYELTALFLKRSAQARIAVVLTGDDLPETWPILDLLMDECDRWDDLSIYAETTIIRGLAKIRGRLPRLARLELIRSEYEEEEPITLDMFSEAPCLHNVIFRYDPSFNILIPWSQLTTFTTSYVELVLILNALRELVNLETLTLDRQGDEGNMGQLPMASLPSLRKLILTTGPDQESHPGLLLDHMSPPALEHLDLDCEDSAICPHVASFISRSGCRLDSFILNYYDTLDAPLLAVLRLMPDLARLDLCGTNATDLFLTQLTRVPPALAPEIIPHLESFILRAHFNQELFLHLIQSRFAPAQDLNEPELVCKLRFVGLKLSVQDIEPVLGHGLSALSALGLDGEMLH
ncbi:hypothetical protein B0H14DRAFT_1178711 [Mycena olivaceomarginata]|nr:hypothetical protein B0H14DRAFT_1178711 [Mycena olivaceomarginata]